jgi:hypothetical protein
MRRRCYLGVKHLNLPHGTTVGDARFLELSADPALARSFARFKDRAPELVCEVEAAGGTDDLVRDRTRKAAERALALVRQQALFGFPAKIYLDQVMFGLDGTYTWYEGAELAQAGWWRNPAPIAMNLAEAATRDWRARLDHLSSGYLSLAPGLRERVDVCLGWPDVAARSDRWPIIIPAAFSAMEAILVPERSGLKAGVVTVRSVAVHVAVGNGFFDPGRVMAGYQLRSDLVHGTPTPDALDTEATKFAEFTRRWASTSSVTTWPMRQPSRPGQPPRSPRSSTTAHATTHVPGWRSTAGQLSSPSTADPSDPRHPVEQRTPNLRLRRRRPPPVAGRPDFGQPPVHGTPQ